MSNQMNVYFTSEMPEMKKALQSVIRFLNKKLPSIEDDDLFDLRLIYSELLANAVIHGNKADATKKVEINIKLNKRIVSSVVKDEGNGFDYMKMMKPEDAPEDVFIENGRGIRLVVGLTDHLGFNERGNEINFSKKVRLKNK